MSSAESLFCTLSHHLQDVTRCRLWKGRFFFYRAARSVCLWVCICERGRPDLVCESALNSLHSLNWDEWRSCCNGQRVRLSIWLDFSQHLEFRTRDEQRLSGMSFSTLEENILLSYHLKLGYKNCNSVKKWFGFTKFLRRFYCLKLRLQTRTERHEAKVTATSYYLVCTR